jgi:hypothetical protein
MSLIRAPLNLWILGCTYRISHPKVAQFADCVREGLGGAESDPSHAAALFHDDGSSLFSPRRQSSLTMFHTARSVGWSDLLIGTILSFVGKFFTLGSFFKLDLLKK